MLRLHFLFAVSLLALIAANGCSPPKTAKKADAEGAQGANAQQEDGTGIFKKYTQEIVEYDSSVHKEMEKEELGLVSGALGGGYGIATEQIAGQNFTRSLEMFRATEGRYPKDYKEFMDKVIKQGGMKLPMLRTNRQYAYDVDNHAIKIVEKPKE